MEYFYKALFVWNVFSVPAIYFLVFTDWFATWPKIARIGYAIAATGLLMEMFLFLTHTNGYHHPYWALKDIGLGILAWSYLYHYFKTKKYMKRNLHPGPNRII